MSAGAKLAEGIAAVMAVLSGMAFSLHHHEFGLSSGTAAVIFFLLGLVLYFIEKATPREIRAADQTTHQISTELGTTKSSVGSGSGRVITKLTPSQIVSDVKNSRPFQKEGIAKTFQDIPVTWILTLTSLSTNEDRVSWLLSDGSAGVFTVTSKADVVRLAFLEKGARLLVSGIIKKVDDNWVDLRDATIELAD